MSVCTLRRGLYAEELHFTPVQRVYDIPLRRWSMLSAAKQRVVRGRLPAAVRAQQREPMRAGAVRRPSAQQFGGVSVWKRRLLL